MLTHHQAYIIAEGQDKTAHCVFLKASLLLSQRQKGIAHPICHMLERMPPSAHFSHFSLVSLDSGRRDCSTIPPRIPGRTIPEQRDKVLSYQALRRVTPFPGCSIGYTKSSIPLQVGAITRGMYLCRIETTWLHCI